MDSSCPVDILWPHDETGTRGVRRGGTRRLTKVVWPSSWLTVEAHNANRPRHLSRAVHRGSSRRSSPLIGYFLARRHHTSRLHTEYSKMAMWLATSRLSPFSFSLLSSTSPAQLPNLPTLAELQKHAEDVKSSVVDTVQPYLPSEDTVTPGVASTKRPPPVVAISRSVCQPVRPTGLGYTAPPPPYRSYDEGVMITEGTRGDGGVGGRDEGGRKLKKGRVGWKPLQSGIPDEDRVSAITKTEESEGKTMGWWEW